MTDFKFNANHYVKVKLTEKGEEVLKKKHDDLVTQIKERGGENFIGDFELRTDAEGYYKAQLWSIMEDFGQEMSVTSANCFSLDMIFVDGEAIEDVPDPMEKLPIKDVMQQLEELFKRKKWLEDEARDFIKAGEYQRAIEETEKLQKVSKNIEIIRSAEVLIDWSER